MAVRLGLDHVLERVIQIVDVLRVLSQLTEHHVICVLHVLGLALHALFVGSLAYAHAGTEVLLCLVVREQHGCALFERRVYVCHVCFYIYHHSAEGVVDPVHVCHVDGVVVVYIEITEQPGRRGDCVVIALALIVAVPVRKAYLLLERLAVLVVACQIFHLDHGVSVYLDETVLLCGVVDYQQGYEVGQLTAVRIVYALAAAVCTDDQVGVYPVIGDEFSVAEQQVCLLILIAPVALVTHAVILETVMLYQVQDGAKQRDQHERYDDAEYDLFLSGAGSVHESGSESMCGLVIYVRFRC